jgi:L-alanine-DL-glutamate epimerase-like enolase superfamily enzyme
MIRRLDLYHVDVRLKRPIRHASHERTTSDNLVVRVTLADGTTGFGEGVPRAYVTGETLESTFATLSSHDWPRAIGRPADYHDVVRKLESLEIPETAADPRGMAGNAARCALELAILDAYGQSFGEPLGTAIRLVATPGLRLTTAPTAVRYSGAITAETRWKETISALKMRLNRFAHVKLKVGIAGADEPARLRRVRRIVGRRVDVRLDANEAWRAADLVDRVRPLLPFRPSVLEQPLPVAENDALTDLRPRLGIPVMLDESLCGYPDATASLANRTADFFNVRLSKCGGVIPSLRIMALAHANGLGLQLGCHPGETGLLSAAGRHVAGNVTGLQYVEGSYDRHVLAENLTEGDITFGYRGWAPPLDGPGLGVHVNAEALERMTVHRKELTYD